MAGGLPFSSHPISSHPGSSHPTPSGTCPPQRAFLDSIKQHPCGDMHAFAGFDELRQQEERYLPQDELTRKYEGVAHGWRADDAEKAAT